MANMLALGMQSLAKHLEEEGAASDAVFAAYDATASMATTQLSSVFIDTQAKEIKVTDANLEPMAKDQRRHTWVIELIENFEGPVDVPALSKTMRSGNYQELPGILKSKTDWAVAYDLNLALVPKGTSPQSWIAVKAYNFAKSQTASVVLDKIVQDGSVACVIDFGCTANKKTGLYVFQRLFEQFGGLQFRHWAWPEAKKRKEEGKRAQMLQSLR